MPITDKVHPSLARAMATASRQKGVITDDVLATGQHFLGCPCPLLYHFYLNALSR